MRKLNYIIIFCLFVVMGCKTQTDIIKPDTELIVKTNVTGILTSNVRVVLFNNSSYYQAASLTNSSKNAVDSAFSSVNGELTFKNLDPTVNYWMLATWTDPISKKTYNNLNTTNYVLNKLAASSQTYIGIDLLQSGTYVAFWTSDSTKLPITIVIEKDTFILNTFSAKAPTILDSTNYLKVNLNPSALNFQAYNSQKQYFDFDTVATVKDRIKLKEINKPEFDVISFYYSGTNSYVYPITLVLDFTDTVGVIKGPRTTAFSCGQADTTNVVTIVRPIGSHTYVAISKGGCSWKGELVSNDSSSCYIVPLSANLNCQ